MGETIRKPTAEFVLGLVREREARLYAIAHALNLQLEALCHTEPSIEGPLTERALAAVLEDMLASTEHEQSVAWALGVKD